MADSADIYYLRTELEEARRAGAASRDEVLRLQREISAHILQIMRECPLSSGCYTVPDDLFRQTLNIIFPPKDAK